MTETRLPEMDTTRTITSLLADLRRVQCQLRWAYHYAESIGNNPDADHELVRITLRDSKLNDMNLLGLEREAVTLTHTLEVLAKCRVPA